VQNPGVDAVSAPSNRQSSGRHPLRIAGIIAGGVVVVVAGAALILFLWLRTYAPLGVLGAGTFAPGPGLAADIEPVTGSGGKPVFVPSYSKPRTFDTAFTLHNSGHFAVTVLGLAAAPAGSSSPQATALLATDSPSADPGGLRAFETLRLDPDDTATFVVRWQLACAAKSTETAGDSIQLRYRYLSLFTRTERVRLPFAVTLRCARRP
jgi:hypothetical protein